LNPTVNRGDSIKDHSWKIAFDQVASHFGAFHACIQTSWRSTEQRRAIIDSENPWIVVLACGCGIRGPKKSGKINILRQTVGLFSAELLASPA
jgi:hypothetical protein